MYQPSHELTPAQSQRPTHSPQPSTSRDPPRPRHHPYYPNDDPPDNLRQLIRGSPLELLHRWNRLQEQEDPTPRGPFEAADGSPSFLKTEQPNDMSMRHLASPVPGPSSLNHRVPAAGPLSLRPYDTPSSPVQRNLHKERMEQYENEQQLWHRGQAATPSWQHSRSYTPDHSPFDPVSPAAGPHHQFPAPSPSPSPASHFWPGPSSRHHPQEDVWREQMSQEELEREEE